MVTVTENGTGSGDITLTAEKNEGAERIAAVTLKADGFDDIVINVTQAEGTAPSPEKTLAFAGSDFEDWDAFLGALKGGKLKSYAVQSSEGRTGSALKIETTTTGNDELFTTVVPAGGSALKDKSKITFYIKGTSSAKSLAIKVFGSSNAWFKVRSIGTEDVIVEANAGGSYYDGTIDTQGNWVKVTLNIKDLDIVNDEGENQLTLKVGKESDYNILIDDITVE